MKNPKAKGSAFERTVCKQLSLWITGGKKSDCFWRSAMSGGRSTRHGTQVRQCGDIASVSPEGHILTDFWLIECKHVKNLRLRGFFDNKASAKSMHAYWLRARADATRFSKDPMLIAKENNGPILVCVPFSATQSKSSPIGLKLLHKLDGVHIMAWGATIFLFDELLKLKFAR